MERLSVHQKSPKQAKAKKKAIKVVYISNPMMFTANSADFRAVVQKLTGRDSDIADFDVPKYPTAAGAAEDFPAAAPAAGSGVARDSDFRRPESRADHGAGSNYENPNGQVEMIYETFSARMQEDFPALVAPPLYYGPHVGGGSRSSGEM